MPEPRKRVETNVEAYLIRRLLVPAYLFAQLQNLCIEPLCSEEAL